ncbi:hypothetical protein KI387_016306, partial [Taxus chinensis]
MRVHTKGKELVRAGVTRFATNFLTLQSISSLLTSLKQMFVSQAWLDSQYSKKADGERVAKIVFDDIFAKRAIEIIKVSELLVRVLRLVDGEQNPMGFVYEAMDRTKEYIQNYYMGDIVRYGPFWEIIDRRWNNQLHQPIHAAGGTTSTPSSWWEDRGGNTPNLQKLALRILSQPSSASGCECNWSLFEAIHTKKRNKFTQKRLNDLVFVQYNLRLRTKKVEATSEELIDLDEIDPYSEWTGQEEENPAFTTDEIASFEREAMEGEALVGLRGDIGLDDIFGGDLQHATEEPPAPPSSSMIEPDSQPSRKSVETQSSVGTSGARGTRPSPQFFSRSRKRKIYVAGILQNPSRILSETYRIWIRLGYDPDTARIRAGYSRIRGGYVSLPDGASIVLSSTVSPGFIKGLEKRLEGENRDLQLVDAPVSGGVVKASSGKLTIMAAGTDEALKRTGAILSALSEKLYIIKGGAGAGSSVKMVNQLLAGVHIAAAAEAMAFGARLGLNTQNLFDIISNAAGNSWMFGNRVPHMLENDYTPHSALDIFVKDLGIVLHESTNLKIPLYIASAAHQQFLLGSAAGWGRHDDAGVVKIFEKLTGVSVEAKVPILPKEETLESLPSEWPVDPIPEIQRLEDCGVAKVLVVLDDDPTGTQTVHGVTVLTEWSIESLVQQFKKKPSCFFILTNSRALSSDKAILLTKEICKNLESAAASESIGYTVVLRGDSTLRGHFPEEADAAASVIGETDAWIICPFFLQGGRYTIANVHYVADGNRLVPAGQTEFAKDASFGYKSSNLCQWVEEKTNGRVAANSVASVSIEAIRKGGPSAVCQILRDLPKGSICIVNAASERDMSVFAAGMIKAEMQGRRFLCRSAASFVSARIGIKPKEPITPRQLGIFGKQNGGLVVVGSYVPKTTKQVEELKVQCGHFLRSIEVRVDAVALKSTGEREEEICRTAELADTFLKSRKDVLIVTSRELVKGSSPSESLDINSRVSSALVEIVRRIQIRPRYLLAKGGITSSDLATKAMGARRAEVAGQALAGVPLWQLGPESRHPGVPYIVFPGNVGGNDALAQVVKNWALTARSSTKDLLLEAERCQYAVGAFNVYNLEAVAAVVAAAEAEKSPAILQIHPSALKHGGAPLVACCVSAAEHAAVPITVHIDHGTEKQELVETLKMGVDSVMVDGSHLPFSDNVSYTKYITTMAHAKSITVEAELGRLSGTEDNLTVDEYEAKLTDVVQAEEFLSKTGVDALAVCIGNVHGKYPPSGPKLRLDLLKELHAIASKKGVVLVLHGASGLPEELVKSCIDLGVRKFNVNTEVRSAYMNALRTPKKDLIDVMSFARESMQAVVAEKMR